MSRYVITTEGEKWAYTWTTRIEVGWDAIRREFYLHLQSRNDNIHSRDEDWSVTRPTFRDLLEAVKSRNKYIGIRGLGYLGRTLKALEQSLESDQEHNVSHGETIDGTATDIPSLPELLA